MLSWVSPKCFMLSGSRESGQDLTDKPLLSDVERRPHCAFQGLQHLWIPLQRRAALVGLIDGLLLWPASPVSVAVAVEDGPSCCLPHEWRPHVPSLLL